MNPQLRGVQATVIFLVWVVKLIKSNYVLVCSTVIFLVWVAKLIKSNYVLSSFVKRRDEPHKYTHIANSMLSHYIHAKSFSLMREVRTL